MRRTGHQYGGLSPFTPAQLQTDQPNGLCRKTGATLQRVTLQHQQREVTQASFFKIWAKFCPTRDSNSFTTTVLDSPKVNALLFPFLPPKGRRRVFGILGGPTSNEISALETQVKRQV